MTIKNYKLKIKNCREGFTLIELLLVIAIIASLAGLILAALNPAQRLDEANEVKALASGNDVEKAIKAYTVENAGVLPTSLSALTTSGIYDVCKSGETIGCINLDQLVTSGKISSIPTDARYATTHTSGYKISYNPTTTEAKVFSQTEYEETTKYCPPGDSCSGPIAEWLFEEGVGTTADDTANNNNGTLFNGTLWTAGYKGNGLNFDSTDDYVSVGDMTSIEGVSQATWSFWIKGDQWNIGQLILSKTNLGASDVSWIFSHSNTTQGRIVLVIPTIATDTTTSGYAESILAGTDWKHMTVVFDGTLSGNSNRLKFYLNGTQVALSYSGTIPSSIRASNSNMLIGGIGGVTGYGVDGIMDEIKVYNYARTPAQIAWEYNQGLPIAYWKFDETSGTSAADSSGNNLNGTLTNGPTWTTGKYSNAINLDGTNDYVEVPYNSLHAPANSISFGGWVRYSSTSGGQRIMSKTQGGGYQLSLNENSVCTSDTLCSLMNIGGSYYFVSYPTASLTTSTWYHIFTTYDGETINLYLNGNIIGTNTSPSGNISYVHNNALCIGNEVGALVCDSSHYHSGLLDDIRLYNYALTPSQVMQAMHER